MWVPLSPLRSPTRWGRMRAGWAPAAGPRRMLTGWLSSRVLGWAEHFPPLGDPTGDSHHHHPPIRAVGRWGGGDGTWQQDKTPSREEVVEVVVYFFGGEWGWGWVPLPCRASQGWGGEQAASCCLLSCLFPFLQTTSALFGFSVCSGEGGRFSLFFQWG